MKTSMYSLTIFLHLYLQGLELLFLINWPAAHFIHSSLSSIICQHVLVAAPTFFFF